VTAQQQTGEPLQDCRKNWQTVAMCQDVIHNLRPTHVGTGRTLTFAIGAAVPVIQGTGLRGLYLTLTIVWLGIVHALPLLRPGIIPMYVDVDAHISNGRDVGRAVAQEVGARANPGAKI